MRSALPDARLLLAGAGAAEGELRSVASKLRLGETVSFLGQQDDVSLLMAASDLLVLPSLWRARRSSCSRRGSRPAGCCELG